MPGASALAAFPLFATGPRVTGFFGLCRERKNAATLAACS